MNVMVSSMPGIGQGSETSDAKWRPETGGAHVFFRLSSAAVDCAAVFSALATAALADLTCWRRFAFSSESSNVSSSYCSFDMSSSDLEASSCDGKNGGALQ